MATLLIPIAGETWLSNSRFWWTAGMGVLALLWKPLCRVINQYRLRKRMELYPDIVVLEQRQTTKKKKKSNNNMTKRLVRWIQSTQRRLVSSLRDLVAFGLGQVVWAARLAVDGCIQSLLTVIQTVRQTTTNVQQFFRDRWRALTRSAPPPMPPSVLRKPKARRTTSEHNNNNNKATTTNSVQFDIYESGRIKTKTYIYNRDAEPRVRTPPPLGVQPLQDPEEIGRVLSERFKSVKQRIQTPPPKPRQNSKKRVAELQQRRMQQQNDKENNATSSMPNNHHQQPLFQSPPAPKINANTTPRQPAPSSSSTPLRYNNAMSSPKTPLLERMRKRRMEDGSPQVIIMALTQPPVQGRIMPRAPSNSNKRRRLTGGGPLRNPLMEKRKREENILQEFNRKRVKEEEQKTEANTAGAAPSTTTTATKPIVFGTPSNTEEGFKFGGAKSDAATSTPGFTFGASAAATPSAGNDGKPPAVPNTAAGDAKPATTTPAATTKDNGDAAAFTFGTGTPAAGTNATTDAAAAQQPGFVPTPAFQFGSTATNTPVPTNDASKTPSGDAANTSTGGVPFGNAPTATNSTTPAPSTDSKPFVFGATPAPATNDNSTATGTFQFGAGATANPPPATATPSFAFGSQPPVSTPAAPPGTNSSAAPTPAGANSFAFGGATTNSATAPPPAPPTGSFAFGANSSTATPAQTPASTGAFAFGANATPSGTAPPAPSAGFSFGAPPANKPDPPAASASEGPNASSFSFGSAPQPGANAAPSFGTAGGFASTPAPAPGFGFAATPAPATPGFPGSGFGVPPASAATTPGFVGTAGFSPAVNPGGAFSVGAVNKAPGARRRLKAKSKRR